MTSDQLPPLFLGIDGGGTRTRAALVNRQGQVLGLGEAGPSNIDDLGRQEAQRNIGRAVSACWQQAGLAPQPVRFAFFGMAGVVSEADRDVIRQVADELQVAVPGGVAVDHDIRIALAGGLAGEPGIVVIVGTGSSCYGRNPQGQDCRVGGWGHWLDDGGSGYFLGLQAMIAAVRSADGRLEVAGGQPSSLLPAVVQALQIESIDLIMHRLYYQNMSRSEIAALAPLVLQAAQQGDQAARDILQRGAEEVALMVQTASRRLNFPPAQLQVTLVGGLVESSAFYRAQLAAALQERLPGVQVVPPRLPPVLGAALLALQYAGEALDPQVLSNLSRGVKS